MNSQKLLNKIATMRTEVQARAVAQPKAVSMANRVAALTARVEALEKELAQLKASAASGDSRHASAEGTKGLLTLIEQDDAS